MSTLPITSLDEAIERLYELNVGVIGTGAERHERPHKPVLILAVLDLIGTGEARPDRVPWSQGLRQRFAPYFDVVRKNDDQNTPENPFYYLKGDGFWEPIVIEGKAERPLDNTPTVAQANSGSVFAKVTGGMEQSFRSSEQRVRLRDALISRYFPTARSQIMALFLEARAPLADDSENAARCREEEPEPSLPGRNPAFRRIVLEAYDFQCAACGLRIKLPDADVTFVDGAHIVPFTESRNDHPTNGLALCKNHHWAMDRFLIVPAPDGFWKSSPKLDARRSRGEEALTQLNGQPLLPPHDEAFRPHRENLAWRAARLYC